MTHLDQTQHRKTLFDTVFFDPPSAVGVKNHPGVHLNTGLNPFFCPRASFFSRAPGRKESCAPKGHLLENFGPFRHWNNKNLHGGWDQSVPRGRPKLLYFSRGTRIYQPITLCLTGRWTNYIGVPHWPYLVAYVWGALGGPWGDLPPWSTPSSPSL